MSFGLVSCMARFDLLCESPSRGFVLGVDLHSCSGYWFDSYSWRFDRFVFTEVLFHSWEVLVRVWYEVADSRSICIKFGLIDLWCQCKVVLKCCVPSCRTWLVRNVRIVAVFA